MSNYICGIRCAYRQPSGYCGITGGYETCQYRIVHQPNTVVGYVPPLKKTRADRIRAMTDEELAEWISEYTDCLCGIHKPGCSKTKGTCVATWLDWLKQEVET